MDNLVSIVEDCEAFHDLKFNDDDVGLFIEHLERCTGRDEELFSRVTCTEDARKKFLAGRLLLFSYLAGRTEIITGSVGHTRIITIMGPEDLYALKITEVGINRMYSKRRTDRRLYNLYMGIMRRGYVNGFPDIASQIDTLGNDSAVVDHLGVPVNYRTVKECPLPYRKNHRRNHRRDGRRGTPRKVITEEDIRFIVSRGAMYEWDAALAKKSIAGFSEDLINKVFKENKPKGAAK